MLRVFILPVMAAVTVVCTGEKIPGKLYIPPRQLPLIAHTCIVNNTRGKQPGKKFPRSLIEAKNNTLI